MNRHNKIIAKLEHVTHYYEKDGKPIKVLDDLCADIMEGEFVSVIGPSGCGKSTLLFIIAGFFSSTEGTVWHTGRKVTCPSSQRGVVFQEDAIFPWLTVYENIAFGSRFKNMPKKEKKQIVQKYIRLVGLEGWKNQYPKQLSGGMKKRVDVARVWANNPEVLLLDESFGSLDTQTKENLQIALLDLWDAEKKTAIFVTHDIEESIFLAGRILIMSKNPGRFVRMIEVPFERPRRRELKMTKEFQEFRREIIKILAYEIQER